MSDNKKPILSTEKPFRNTNELQRALTEAEGLLSVALFCFNKTDDKTVLGGVEAALFKAMVNVKATGKALDSVNVHKLAEFSKGVAA